MYKNFKEYWKGKKEVLEKSGVTKEIAKMIWSDAIDCVEMALLRR